MDHGATITLGAVESSILLVADHASNHVPADVDLGIAPDVLNTHIAVDLGVAELGAALCARLACPGVFAGVSRLVIDLNREEEAPHIIPTVSDGHVIPGNALSHTDRQARIERYWRPYHARIAEHIVQQRPKLLISLHSFTPQLETRPGDVRPWEIGILYNQDDRAARIAIPLLVEASIVVGDQLPYSGTLLNATMNRHGEGNGISYLGLEIRQDLIRNAAGVARWAEVLAPVIESCLSPLFPRL